MSFLPPSLSSDEDEPQSKTSLEKNPSNEEADSSEDDEVNKNFEFGGILGEDGGIASFSSSNLGSGTVTEGWSYQTALDSVGGNGAGVQRQNPPRMDVASLISAKRKSFLSQEKKHKKGDPKQKKEDSEEGSKYSESDSDSDAGSSSSDSDDGDEEVKVDESHRKIKEEDVLKTRAGKEGTEICEEGEEGDDSDSLLGDDKDDPDEAAKAAAFFDSEKTEPLQEEIEVFAQLTLSRPLLRGVAAMGFVKPTPIQAAVIPKALAGRDVCASAVTGSGKTAAFLLPVLERLLHRQTGRTRVLILTPTRELAAQCLGMMTTFAQFTKIRAALIVGGAKNVNAQATELRARPEMIVATPGRLLDHVTNSAGVSLSDVEFLVLDEADRLLDLGFQEEVHELIKSCPEQRQTLLFSATMNTKVDDLIKLSLKRPIRVRIGDINKSAGKDLEVAPRLEQEFVRIRVGNEGVNRQGILLALLSRSFTKNVIVFFDTKADAHRLMIICGLCGVKCTELHGNLTQQQRLAALEDFRSGTVDVLLATDLAARGLDIDSVTTVINFEMPTQIDTYIHRIGRTARAGRGGRSCTLIGEDRRHLMKGLIREAASKNKKNTKSTERPKVHKDRNGVIRSRTVPAAVISHFVAKIQSLEPHVKEVLRAEAVARMDRLAEMEAIKAQNIIKHSDEINARPQREWFASKQQKQNTKEAAAADHHKKKMIVSNKLGTGVHRMTRKKRRSREAREFFMANDNGDDNDDDDNNNNSTPLVDPFVQQKSDARARKRKKDARQRESRDISIRDEDGNRIITEGAKKKKKKKKKDKKGATNYDGDAFGDSSLFNDEKVAFAQKQTTKGEAPVVAKSSYEFRGYNPDKKLGKKKGHKAFKSKSKYKRR